MVYHHPERRRARLIPLHRLKIGEAMSETYPHYPRFLDVVSAPRQPTPQGAWDTAVHVYGPEADYPFASSPKAFLPDTSADVAAVLRMHATLGIDQGVIVQASSYMSDHRVLVDALHVAGPNYVGIGLVFPDTSDAELEKLKEAGLVGARFNMVPWLIEPISHNDLRVLLGRIDSLGWLAHLHVDASDIAKDLDFYQSIDAKVCVDHMGHSKNPDPESPEAVAMRSLLEKENWWMRLSNADRWSALDDGFDDMGELMASLIEAAPSRCVWGTDWPHVNYFHRDQMVDDGHLLDLLARVTSPEQYAAILVDNPRRLYRGER